MFGRVRRAVRARVLHAGAMPTALSGHVNQNEARASRKARRRLGKLAEHAHAEPWAWHPQTPTHCRLNPAGSSGSRCRRARRPCCWRSTNYLCQDVASLPLLWVAPLAVYLVTFIIAFDADRWYVRWRLAGRRWASPRSPRAWSWQAEAPGSALATQVSVHLALLLTVGHGVPRRGRPAAARRRAAHRVLPVPVGRRRLGRTARGGRRAADAGRLLRTAARRAGRVAARDVVVLAPTTSSALYHGHRLPRVDRSSPSCGRCSRCWPCNRTASAPPNVAVGPQLLRRAQGAGSRVAPAARAAC